MRTLVLFLVLLTPVVQAVQEPAAPPTEATFSYSGASAIQGRFQGSCQASGVQFPTDKPDRIEVQSHGGVLHIVRTRVNVTIIAPATYDMKPDKQWVESFNVSAGRLVAYWPESGLGAAFANGWEQGIAEPFQIQAALTHANISAIGRGPSVADLHWTPSKVSTPVIGAAPSLSTVAFSGWNRRIAWEGEADAAGNTTYYLRQAAVETPGNTFTLPAFETWESDITTPVGARRTILFTDGLLVLEDARWRVPSDASLVCQDLKGRVSGGFVADLATGEGRAGEQQVTFAGKALTLEGDFDLTEKPAGDMRTSEGGRIEAHASGDIRGLGIEFSSVWRQPATVYAAEAGLLALFLAALLLVVKYAGSIVGAFYSRFGRDQALENPSRDAIYQAVRQSPGLDLSGLRRITSFHLSTVAYHVQVLRRVGLIGAVREGKSVRIVPKELHTKDGLAQVAASADERVAFVVERARAGSVPLRETVEGLMERFRLPQRTAYRVVERAVRRNAVVRVGLGKEAMLRCAP